jgi:hypothetical protein
MQGIRRENVCAADDADPANFRDPEFARLANGSESPLVARQ